ncbi:MAG: pirin family protein [Legionellales bacterium]
MSDLIKASQIMNSRDCLASPDAIHQQIKTRNATIGDNLTIRRALPHRDRKTIGAWCFLDHMGPLALNNNQGLDIGPHPHIGLQTFTWSIAGEILHRDSLGSQQVIKSGQVNLMTAGKGISHSEESLPVGDILHGVQLWIALPETVRHMEPNFIHYPSIPTVTLDGLQINLLVGEFLNIRSPVQVYSPLVGIEVNALKNTSNVLPLNPKFEYGILPLKGAIEVNNETFGEDTLLYLSCGHSSLPIRTSEGAKVLIIGGEPFNEDILIWWNFVARTKAELVQATNSWNEHKQFGEVKGYSGDRLTAPKLL